MAMSPNWLGKSTNKLSSKGVDPRACSFIGNQQSKNYENLVAFGAMDMITHHYGVNSAETLYLCISSTVYINSITNTTSLFNTNMKPSQSPLNHLGSFQSSIIPPKAVSAHTLTSSCPNNLTDSLLDPALFFGIQDKHQAINTINIITNAAHVNPKTAMPM
jgi:hypothetical protein